MKRRVLTPTIPTRPIYLLGLLLLLLLTSCTGGVKPEPEQEVHPVWPAAPEKAHLEWVGEYRVLKETAARKGFFGHLANFFLGPKIAYLERPYGVCTDGGQQLFIADAGGGKIHVFDMVTGDYSAITGDKNTALQSPINIRYIAGSLYLTDSVQGVVLRYLPEEDRLVLWSQVELERPTGLAFDKVAERFYVSDSARHEIVILDRNGGELFRFGSWGAGPGQFNFPTDLWVDNDGQLYVTDALNARVQVFDTEGNYLREFGRRGDTQGRFSKPKGVAVDSHGHVFVVDALFDAVQIFDTEGRLLMAFGDNGVGAGQFWLPSGIFIDGRNYVYVSDTYNRRIQVFKELE
ncbi:MAG: 6-bladed beta-propeller [Desulfuromonas sp.]|nr:MAG: 6-bladed beta-propeller [Desulfuromonas sp.]